MGLREILLGRSKLQQPAPERLFAITTAYLTLQTGAGLEPTGTAAIVFQPLATADFESTMREMEKVVTATGAEEGTQVASHDDTYGYRWMVVRNGPGKVSVEELAVAINAVSGSIEGSGHGERLLCSVFAFRDTHARRAGGVPPGGGAPAGGSDASADDSGAPAGDGAAGGGEGAKAYFIYNYKRGFWYPFVPASAAEQRTTERELQLKAQIGSELPIEPELERWFPLWGIPI